MSLFDKYIVEAIENNKIRVTGELHVGTHNAEELGFYHGFFDDAYKNQILWIEGNPEIYYIDEFEAKTVTLKTFFDDLKIDTAVYNYRHLNIQGAVLWR